MSPDHDALRDRFHADELMNGDGVRRVAESRLANALDAIGWRAANGASSDEVAARAVYIVSAYASHSVDRAATVQSLAELLRASTGGMDGSLPPTSAFIPAAEDVLRRYAAGASAERELEDPED